MSLYYLLLLIEQFHNYPRLGGTLFKFAFVSVSVVKIVGVLVVVASLLLARPRDAAPRRRNAMGLLFCLFAGYSLLGTVLRGLPFPDDDFSYLISLVFMLIAARGLVCTKTRVRNTVRTMVLVTAFSSLWDFKQGLLGGGRAWGVEGDPNYEALALVIVIPLALWMLHHETERRWRVIGGGAAAMLGIAALLTQSRGGLLSFPIIGISELAHTKKRAGPLIFSLALGTLLVAFAPSSIWQRFGLLGRINVENTNASGDELSTEVHFDLLLAGLRMMVAHPLAGVGLDQFKAAAPSYSPQLRKLGITNIAHNSYLQIGAEAGLPALSLFLILMVMGFSNYRSASRLAGNDMLAEIGRAMRLSLVVYAVVSFFLTAWFLLAYWLLVFLSQNLREIAWFSRSRGDRSPAEDRFAVSDRRASQPNVDASSKALAPA